MPISMHDDYRTAGFAGEMGFGEKPALIVVDLVMAYFEQSSPMYASVEPTLANVLALVDVARSRSVPIIFTQQFYNEEISHTTYARKVPALALLRQESSLSALHPSLFTGDGTILIKGYPSAFYKTDLGARLSTWNIDTLIITGLTTSGCVRATAMDAMLNDLKGIVVHDAVGDRNDVQHEANLFDIQAKLADVRSTQDTIEWLSKV